ncbi:MAG: hypothetical protein AAF039_05705 [Bacteroidota bacterium]
MEKKLELTKQWIRLGSYSGIASTVLFLLLILVDMPMYLQFLFAGLFGISYALLGFGIDHAIRLEKETITSRLGALFVFVAGILFNVMLMMQLTFKGQLEMYQNEILELTHKELFDPWIGLMDTFQLGIQFSIDLLTACAMLFFSIDMFKHRFFGRPWAISGAIIAVSLVVIKCISFPLTPGELGIPYVLGPMISLWFLAVCIQNLRVSKNVVRKEVEVYASPQK